mgnify:CR=1 FL=1
MPKIDPKRDSYVDSKNPDTRPGPYYVSVIDGDRYMLLLGPFDTHSEALAAVEPVRKYVMKAYASDLKVIWYAFGTVRIEPDDTKPAYPGKLNGELADLLPANKR